MELVVTRRKNEIQAIDSEIINKKFHTISFIQANADRHPN